MSTATSHASEGQGENDLENSVCVSDTNAVALLHPMLEFCLLTSQNVTISPFRQQPHLSEKPVLVVIHNLFVDEPQRICGCTSDKGM